MQIGPPTLLDVIAIGQFVTLSKQYSKCRLRWHLLQLLLHRRHKNLKELAAPKFSVCAGIQQVCQVWTLHPEDDC